MKIVGSFVVLGMCATAKAFTSPETMNHRTCSALSMSSIDRMTFLRTSVGAAFLATTVSPDVAKAAKYGSFGAGSPEVLDPQTAIVDEEILKSEAVQSALTNIKAYSAAVKQMTDALAANSQVDIGPTIQAELDFATVRSTLNTFNTAFDEDTQRGTDRLVRIILQDLIELDQSNRQKPGIERSSRRIETMNAKLEKLGKAFQDYLAFA